MNIYQLLLSIKLDPNDLGIPNHPLDPESVQKILGIVFMWGGILAVLMIVASGLVYITSSGDAAKVSQAKNMIIYSCVGLLVMVLASLIVKTILGEF